jgi:selenocysteine lyase/cysteine desulfurase
MEKLIEARKQFPVVRQMIYLDAACIVPSPDCVVEAVSSFYMNLNEKGEDRQSLEEKTEAVCKKFARLINAASEEVVTIKNTTEGLNIAANGLPFKAGDNVIITDLEHLNNVYPWTNLQKRKGIEVRILKNREGRLFLDDLSALVDNRTRALSISFVTFTGLKIDLKSFGQFCKAHDMYFIVDGIQGVGRLSLDVKESFIDIMSCGAHKGLMAGRGIGCLYIDKRILDNIEVTYAGPPIELRHEPVSTVFKQSNGARKFNAGGANYLGICALHAGLELLEKIGITSIEPYDLELGELLVESLKEIKGVKILSPRSPDESSGIVSFTTPDNTKVAEHLGANKIKVSCRGSGIRVSPHFYNPKEEITRTVEVVAELLAHRTR